MSWIFNPNVSINILFCPLYILETVFDLEAWLDSGSFLEKYFISGGMCFQMHHLRRHAVFGHLSVISRFIVGFRYYQLDSFIMKLPVSFLPDGFRSHWHWDSTLGQQPLIFSIPVITSGGTTWWYSDSVTLS